MVFGCCVTRTGRSPRQVLAANHILAIQEGSYIAMAWVALTTLSVDVDHHDCTAISGLGHPTDFHPLSQFMLRALVVLRGASGSDPREATASIVRSRIIFYVVGLLICVPKGFVLVCDNGAHGRLWGSSSRERL